MEEKKSTEEQEGLQGSKVCSRGTEEKKKPFKLANYFPVTMFYFYFSQCVPCSEAWSREGEEVKAHYRSLGTICAMYCTTLRFKKYILTFLSISEDISENSFYS